jgi:hypothetical protein
LKIVSAGCINYMLGDGTSPRGVERPMAVEVAAARRRFTRDEYHRMAEVGILADPSLRYDPIDQGPALRGRRGPRVLAGRLYRGER